jgi:outer membrane protein assembly factor BamE (lipoprotein component of BamABCDE complex)
MFGRGCGRGAAAIGLAVLFCVPSLGCGPAALVLLSAAGGAAALSGEPQRIYSIQGQDFDEQRIGLIRSGVHTPDDVVGLLGRPQIKTFTGAGEEWAYRYYVPPSLLRPGTEKVLTVRFRDGIVQDVRYSISAL